MKKTRNDSNTKYIDIKTRLPDPSPVWEFHVMLINETEAWLEENDIPTDAIRIQVEKTDGSKVDHKRNKNPPAYELVEKEHPITDISFDVTEGRIITITADNGYSKILTVGNNGATFQFILNDRPT